jgi:sec-independent protein translocase protein TatB
MDSFFGIGLGELFFIAIIALIVLGPERLPGAIREVTKFIRTIRNLSSELTSQFSEEMKAFDDINPTKILRELTDEPEEANKGAAKSGAAATKPPATKPASKPVSTSAAKPKPATGSSTGASAGSAAKKTGTSTATSAGGATKPAAGSAGQTEKPAEATPTAGPSAEGGDENRILPPQADAPKETPAATSTAAPAVASEPPAAQPSADIALPNASHIQDASNGAEPPAHAPQPASSEGDMVVDAAASRPAVSVNGAAKAEGDA